jgi:hypothetical protein
MDLAFKRLSLINHLMGGYGGSYSGMGGYGSSGSLYGGGGYGSSYGGYGGSMGSYGSSNLRSSTALLI